MIDHDCLEGFLAFAENLNFTRGAREMHMTQPALHAQVRRLAASVGSPLYARTDAGLALTAAGRKLDVQSCSVAGRATGVTALRYKSKTNCRATAGFMEG